MQRFHACNLSSFAGTHPGSSAVRLLRIETAWLIRLLFQLKSPLVFSFSFFFTVTDDRHELFRIGWDLYSGNTIKVGLKLIR